MNKIEKEIEYKGYRGCIKLIGNKYTQHRCAYVIIPKENPLYEKDFNELSLDVHGGVNYSEYGEDFKRKTEGELEALKDDDWILGIDFGHGGDEGWTLEQVEEELKHFINEVIRVGKE